jgi:hypothetical protein
MVLGGRDLVGSMTLGRGRTEKREGGEEGKRCDP